MELILPDIGLIFWTGVSFLIVLFILKKYAWGPITNALKERDDSIREALQSAEKAREEMQNLQADNEKLLKEAREERDKIIKEAKETANNIIEESKGQAREESDKIIANARSQIENEKNAAVSELKNIVAERSVEIAEMIVKKDLKDDEAHQELINKYLEESKLVNHSVSV